MATRIDQFRATLAGGGARPTQFKVMLTFPSWVSGTDAAIKAEFLVKGASLPASILMPIDVPFRGRPIKIAGERQFQNWNVTVLNDNDFLIRNAFERWSKGILDHSSVNGRLAPASYETDMIVQQLDRNDNPIKEYKFFNCWPQQVSEIQLDFGAVQNIEEFQVEFSVDYWETL